jgi:histidinol-phosphate aminotransferase
VAGNQNSDNFVIRHNLASNENPFGASNLVYEAIKSFTGINRYPDSNSSKLRDKISEIYNLSADNIICGNGSEELLHLIARAYLLPGDEVLIPQYGFGVYEIAALSVSAVPVFITRKEISKQLSLSSIINSVTSKTRMIFIDHPGNPVSTHLDSETLRTLIKTLPRSIMIVIDAAYAEYMKDDKSYTTGHEFIASHPNVIVTRSFSKAYGLASLRLGWMHASDCVVDAINRIRPPFNVSAIAQSAGIASLNDFDFIDRTVGYTCIWLKKLEDVLNNNNIFFVPGSSNFVLVYLPDCSANFYLSLCQKGILVRPMTMYRMNDYLRISIGTEKAMIELFEEINIFKKEKAPLIKY